MTVTGCHARLGRLVEQWALVPAGEPILTHASCLLPATRDGQPVMLKTSAQPDEVRGFALLDWWQGHGAVRVLERESDALLMERATGGSLVQMSQAGNDTEAIAIICDLLGRLHSGRNGPAPPLVLLSDWFASLFATDAHEPFIKRGKTLASELLGDPEPPTVLHGDMHHGNVVQLSTGDWRAIDPQGLLGPRGYDYANIFRNPNLDIAADPERFRSRVGRVSQLSGLDPVELLQWIVALCALSHSWGQDTEFLAGTDRIIAELALSHLDSIGQETQD